MTTFSKGDRVCRYGKPALGIGVVEDASDGVRVRWTVEGQRYVGFHSKSNLRRERYQVRNIDRDDQRADLFVHVHEDGRPVLRGEKVAP